MTPLELFHSNVGLAKKLVMKVGGSFYARRCGLQVDDLHQIAQMALWHACQRFDASRGVSFATYAWRCIHGQLLQQPQQFRYGGERQWSNSLDYTFKVKTMCTEDGESMDFPSKDDTVESVVVLEIKENVHRAIKNVHYKRAPEATFGHAIEGKQFAEMAREFGVSRERTRQAYAHALEEMKHDRRLQMLAEEQG